MSSHDMHEHPGSAPRPAPVRDASPLGISFLQSCLVAGCVTVLAPVLLIGGFLVLMFLVLSSGVDSMEKATLGALMQSSAAEPNLRERVLRAGDADAGVIAVVSIQGAIDGSGSTLDGTGSLGFVASQLRAARRNDTVKAVILQIDSPGGGLTASDQLHRQVLRLRESGKPVVAWAGGAMASGGYYIAVAAEEIMASPTSVVGSIGVIMQHFQVQELLRRIGVRVDPVTSTEHKDLGSPFREMTPEERAILEEHIARAHARFVEVVAAGRNMPLEQARALADGSICDGPAALDKGLVDAVGYIEDAVERVEAKLGARNMRVIGYRRQLSLGDLFNEAGSGAAGAVLRAAGEGSAAGMPLRAE